MEIESSTTENNVSSIDYSVTQSISILAENTTASNIDIGENDKNAKDAQNEDKDARDENEDTFESSAVAHSIDGSAVTTSNICVEIDADEPSTIVDSSENLVDKTDLSINIAEGAENASKNEEEDVTMNDKNQETSGSSAAIHSIISSAIDEVAISSIVVETDANVPNKSKGMNVSTNDDDDLSNNYFADDQFSTNNNTVLENAAPSIIAETVAQSVDTEKTDVERSTIEDTSIKSFEHFISNSDIIKTTVSKIVEDASNIKGKKVPSNDDDDLFNKFFTDNSTNKNASSGVENAATLSIFAETTVESVSTENMEVELSTTENDGLSIEFSIAESIKILTENAIVPNLDIAENAENASKNENKDVPTKEDKGVSNSFVVIHSNETDTTTLNIEMDIDDSENGKCAQNKNKDAPTSDGNEKVCESFAVAQSINDSATTISNIGVETDADALSIFAETTVENGDTENTEMNLSTNEDGSIESSIVNSVDKTMESNIDVSEVADDVNKKNENKDVSTNDVDEKASKSSAIVHSISSSAIDDVVISSIVVEIDADAQSKNKGKDVFSSNNDDFSNDLFADDEPSTSSSTVLENAASLITAETTVKSVDTKSMDVELSTTEDASIEFSNHSISNSDGKTIVSSSAEDASKNKGKDVPSNDNDDISNDLFCR